MNSVGLLKIILLAYVINTSCIICHYYWLFEILSIYV